MIPLPVCHRDTRSTCRTRFVSLLTKIEEPLRLVVFGALRGLIRIMTTIVGGVVGRGTGSSTTRLTIRRLLVVTSKITVVTEEHIMNLLKEVCTAGW